MRQRPNIGATTTRTNLIQAIGGQQWFPGHYFSPLIGRTDNAEAARGESTVVRFDGGNVFLVVFLGQIRVLNAPAQAVFLIHEHHRPDGAFGIDA